MQLYESTKPTPYAVECPEHGRVYMMENEYRRQLDDSNKPFFCPRQVKGNIKHRCGADAKYVGTA